MTALNTRTLMASGRMFLPTETDPAVLLWQQTEGEVQPLELLKVFRVLPEKRVVALARWHYQKSLAAGHARNLVLEKLLDTAK